MPSWRHNALRAVVVLLLLQFAGGALVWRAQQRSGASEDAEAVSDADWTAVQGAAETLGEHLDAIAAIVDDLARELSSGADRDALLHTTARQRMEDNTSFVGLSVTSVGEPWLLSGLLRVGDVVLPAMQELPEVADYTRDNAWFHHAQIDGAGWHRPQVFEPTGEPVMIYAAPVCADGPCDLTRDQPTAVMAAMLNLRDLEGIARGLDLGPGAQSLIVSQEGDLVVHPRMDFVRQGLSAHALAWRSGDADLSEALAQIAAGQEGDLGPRIDPQSGRSEHLAWIPFGGAGGASSTHGLIAHLPIVSPRTADQERHAAVARMAIAVPLIWMLLMLAMLLVVSDGVRAAWLASAGAALTAVALITGLWWAAAEHPTPPAPDDLPILTSADLARFEESWTQASGDPVFQSIGIFVQSLEFQSANNVTISGLAWQARPVEACEGVLDEEPEPGFFFPEADPGEELQIALAYHQCDPLRSEELQGWRFRALLRQDFDYLLYPFDPQEIWVRLLPVEFEKNVVLVPDLLSYDRTARESTPGLDRELILPGWDLEGSGFAYRRRAYNTDFGVTNYVGQSDFPELVYTISLKRSFLGPFVGKVIPLGVAAAMLFCMLLLGTRNQDYEGAFGFSAMEVVMGAAALFFVVIFDHSALRDDLATTKPFYLEYFYFVMYVALVGVCGNAILFAMGRGRAVRFRDNLIPKVLFWPLYLGAIAATTLAIFW